MAFNKKITLQTLKQKTGSAGGYDITASANVWCEFNDIGSIIAFKALSAGITVTKQAIMWRKEFNGYTHAIVDGKQYKIEQTVRADNDLHIKLLLSRG
jgi:SPP1 family predicted phage head-tail adaptor